jgi:hypothetical protein
MAKPPQLKSLDDLLAQAEHYANWAMRKLGNVPPTMMGLSPRGPLFFVPSAMTDDRAKDNFANTARLICVAHDATAAVMILESWMKLAAPGETRHKIDNYRFPRLQAGWLPLSCASKSFSNWFNCSARGSLLADFAAALGVNSASVSMTGRSETLCSPDFVMGFLGVLVCCRRSAPPPNKSTRIRMIRRVDMFEP